MRITRRFYRNARSSKPQFIDCTVGVTINGFVERVYPVSIRFTVDEDGKRSTLRAELSKADSLMVGNMLLHAADRCGCSSPELRRYLSKVPQ